MSAKKVIVIVVSWNSKKLLSECLEAVKKNTDYENFEVVVVDNASADGSQELVEKEFDWVRLIKNEKNLGFSKANNIVFQKFHADYYFTLNPDTRVTLGWLSKAVEIAESGKKIGIVGCREVYPHEHGKKDFSGEKPKEVLTVLGGMALIKRSVIENVGVFDEKNFSPAYGEETDLCFRARDCGYTVVQAQNISIIHHGSAVITPQLGLDKRIYLNESHRLKVMLFNLSFAEFLSFVPGLSLNFLQSIVNLKTHILLRAYIGVLLDLGTVLLERKKRKQKAKKARTKILAGNRF